VRTIGLLLVFLLGAGFLVISFQPRIRFADPGPAESLEVRRNYHCYYDRIYGHSSGSDVLFFGASNTYDAVDAKSIGEIYGLVAGEHLSVFKFAPSASNPELMYSFFRDYLARKPAPKMALFELTKVGPNYYAPVRYMHPYFPDLAPPYLYLDVLRSWDFVNSRLFAVSDFLKLLIRHIDLSLSRLLVADYWFMVPPGDNCQPPAPGDPGLAVADPGRYSFEQLLDAEMESYLPPFDRAEVGTTAALLETYAENPVMREAVEKRNKALPRRRKQPFWRDRGQLKERSLGYYRRIVALGEAYGVKIAFYYMPEILAPAPREADVRQLSTSLGAPVYVQPYWYTRIAFHHYRDPKHVATDIRPAFSVWFASLIDKVGKR